MQAVILLPLIFIILYVVEDLYNFSGFKTTPNLFIASSNDASCVILFDTHYINEMLLAELQKAKKQLRNLCHYEVVYSTQDTNLTAKQREDVITLEESGMDYFVFDLDLAMRSYPDVIKSKY